MAKEQIITKGVITAAGSGTRFLPATKSLPKEMLPIIDKPIIHYVVEEMVAAGIKDIMIVTRTDKKPLEDYFNRNPELENELWKANKIKQLDQIKKISQMANFIVISQNGPYGNGTPALNARSFVDNEPFVFAYGDDLVKSKVSFTKQLIENYERNRSVVLGCQEVSREDTSLYGIIKLKEGSEIMEVEDIIEKPAPEEAPSRFAVFGRFILVPEICEILSELPLGKGGELWLTDAIEKYIRCGNTVVAQRIQDGRWYTTGDPLHFLKVMIEYARARDEYWSSFRKYLLNMLQANDSKG